MDDKPVELTYGHVGKTFYDRSTREWLFSRELTRREIGVLSAGKVVVPSPRKRHFSPPPKNALKIHQIRTKGLIQQIPEFSSVANCLTSFSRESEAIALQAAAYNALEGDVFALGRASDLENRRGARIRVAVVPGDENGGVLRIAQLGHERHGWGSDRSIWLDTFPLGRAETGYWIGPGPPIQQVCFSNTHEDWTVFLAVRLPTIILILRPVLQRSPMPPQGPLPGEYPASRLTLEFIVPLPPQNEGCPQADVSFCPFYKRYVGVIDQDGFWTIWDIQGRGHRNSHTYRAVQFRHGNLEPEQDTGLRQSSPASERDESQTSDEHKARTDDGWARILWVRDTNTVLVCKRRQISLFDLSERNVEELKAPDVGLCRSTNWILDAKAHPSCREHVFVLTSTHLIMVHVVAEASDATRDKTGGAKSLLSWRHWRGEEDVTLSLFILEEEEDTTVFVYSRRSPLVSCFTFRSSLGEHKFPVSTADPAEFSIPPELDNRDGSLNHIRGLAIEKLDFREDPSLPPEAGLGATYVNSGLSFYTLRVFFDDFHISEYWVYSRNRDAPGRRHFNIQVPDWTRKFGHGRSAPQVDDSFVVADDLSEEEPPSPVFTPVHYHRTWLDRYKNPKETADRESPGVHYNLIFEEAVERDEPEDFVLFIDDFQRKLTNISDMPDLPLATVFQHLDIHIAVKDVNAASAALANLSIRHPPPGDGQTQCVEVKQQNLLAMLGWEGTDDENMSLSTVYDRIISSWLAPLPQSIPAKTRLAMEKIARQIAAEVCLASSFIRPCRPELTQELESSLSQQVESAHLDRPKGHLQEAKGYTAHQQSSSFLGPAHGHFPREASPILRSSPPTDHLLPTPPATSASVISGSTFTSSGISTLNQGSEARLKRYLSFSKHPPMMTRSAVQTLSHWTVGLDPQTYNWEETRRAITVASEIEAEGLTASQQARLQRKAERHLKRQRREAAATAAKERARDAPLPVSSQLFTRSSPGPLLGMSSQAGPPSQTQPLAASQVVPGPYANKRLDKDKKKKKRKMAGF